MRKVISPIDMFVGEANDGHAELVATSLRESGIVKNLYRGRDGAETLALVRGVWRGCQGVSVRPSLVLLDCGLPPAGGVDVLRVLKGDLRHSWMPVIMMTSTDDRRQAEKYWHLGCAAVVTKWTVFLGLPGFVMRAGFLANRALWIASRRRIVSGIHGCNADTRDLRSMSDVARTRRYEHERIGKDARDESAAP